MRAKLVTMLINLIFILDCLLMYIEQNKDLQTYVSCHTCKKYVTPVYLYHSCTINVSLHTVNVKLTLPSRT